MNSNKSNNLVLLEGIFATPKKGTPTEQRSLRGTLIISICSLNKIGHNRSYNAQKDGSLQFVSLPIAFMYGIFTYIDPIKINHSCR